MLDEDFSQTWSYLRQRLLKTFRGIALKYGKKKYLDTPGGQAVAQLLPDGIYPSKPEHLESEMGRQARPPPTRG